MVSKSPPTSSKLKPVIAEYDFASALNSNVLRQDSRIIQVVIDLSLIYNKFSRL